MFIEFNFDYFFLFIVLGIEYGREDRNISFKLVVFVFFLLISFDKIYFYVFLKK